MSCDAPEGSEQPDGKFAARDDTRWIKHGYSGDAEFRGEYADARLSQRDGDPVVPHVEIHPVMTQNEVTISMAVNSQDDERDPHAGILATFTPDQIFALADALEEVAECAEEGHPRGRAMNDFEDPWRYRCPRGHSNWRAGKGDTYFCHSCGEAFDELVDAKAEADTDEQPAPIRDDPALDDIDDRAERAVVALFDLEQTHLGG